jgi:hypothetical protein
MRFLFPLLIATTLISACKSTGKLSNAADENADSQPSGKVIEGFASPESILIARGAMYVSNVGMELLPKEQDGDGFISKLSMDGVMAEEQFISELHAPKGMAERSGILYVADIDQVKAFKTENGEPVETYDFREYGASFLNDMVFQSENVLLITDTDLNLIFSIDLKSRKVGKISVPDDFSGPNGMYMDRVTQTLSIVGFGTEGEPNGKVAIMYPSDDPSGGMGHFEVLDTPQGMLDGVAMIEGKYIIFSDWGDDGVGRVRYYDINTKETWLVNLENQIQGPADFAFDEHNKCLWIPAMQEGKVYQEFLTFY